VQSTTIGVDVTPAFSPIPWITCRRAAVLDCSVKSGEQMSTLILQTFNKH
jgi:antirestriction protein ArdC